MATTTAGGSGEDRLQCVVCLEEVLRTDLAHLPCCRGGGATVERREHDENVGEEGQQQQRRQQQQDGWMQYCKQCIHALCQRASPIGVARCPSCRAFIQSVDEGNQIVVKKDAGKCGRCGHIKVLIQGLLCDACVLGARVALRYECERCGRYQRIPHPMWRYQTGGVAAFTDDTWACHIRCGEQTKWRVHPEDARHVPSWDAPASWGREEDWKEQVLELRRQPGLLGGTPEDQRRARDRHGKDMKEFALVVLGGLVLGWMWLYSNFQKDPLFEKYTTGGIVLTISILVWLYKSILLR